MPSALVLVDLQYDFCPGGALEVARGDETIAVANREMQRYDTVVATQDWHPPDHGSFAANNPGKKPFELGELGGLPQIMWPVHCVQGTHGAELHAGLDHARIAHVSRKGTDRGVDSYSGFFDNGKKSSTDLAAWLRAKGITDLAILGLATDVCVKYTVLDAVALGFHVTLIADGCRAVDLKPGDGAKAIAEMRAAGVRVNE
jgi:nicotinamidase/pyrazinamidase